LAAAFLSLRSGISLIYPFLIQVKGAGELKIRVIFEHLTLNTLINQHIYFKKTVMGILAIQTPVP
jgi:hypothetical protein